MRNLLFVLVLAAFAPMATSVAPSRSTARRSTLDIYFIDVEGGQSTLMVTPDGESFLVDAGFPGNGTFASTPGEPAAARDANRIGN
jgi:hypothetical protein